MGDIALDKDQYKLMHNSIDQSHTKDSIVQNLYSPHHPHRTSHTKVRKNKQRLHHRKGRRKHNRKKQAERLERQKKRR